MSKLLDDAVRNNILWCGWVSRAHGAAHAYSGNLWRLESQGPPYYPDAITTNRLATMEEIRQLAEAPRPPGSLKDSYALLDLSVAGWKLLFEAQWIHHPATDAGSYPPTWRKAETPEETQAWIAESGLQGVLPPELTRHPDIALLWSRPSESATGFAGNRGAGVVGITNVFGGGGGHEELWSAIPRIAAVDFPGLPLVGYEQGASLAAALKSGWTALGPLRVWIKPS
ncbi:hypothetical protein MJA45_28040 [Paenibacillus aurantius]|uniref:Uncharacterized protein n=1 Tax=Paenibacillus aurantius TaxID=2918900 RepID=A0AA96LG06_9BACL|nr:hypothetical protein [Paenibacillus aurantius]WNQ11405.1 hypothetical protein MJA45_28040 [Paenibacillus aurantius]